jgi:nucleotide-binding universal stress UspA family protein
MGTPFALPLDMKTNAVRRILVPVDFSSCSRAALAFACSLGAALSASIDVLFVASNDGQPDGAAASGGELHQFVGTVPEAKSLAVREHVVHGDARERIVTMAERDGFDLIVLGTHGRTGRARSLAGSVAESVVRTSSRPVVTVREG